MQKGNKKTEPTSSVTKYIILTAIVLIAGYLIYTNFINKDLEENKNIVIDPKERVKNVKEPMFKKEGELEFIQRDAKISLKKINIEVADNDNERTQGLMYRKSMEDERGMLFVFEREEPQSFWMKNTIIPLDIIYINSKKEIVKIFKNTVPFSEKSLPSDGPAIYVVEVNGGFCEKYGIKEGDVINFAKQ